MSSNPKKRPTMNKEIAFLIHLYELEYNREVRENEASIIADIRLKYPEFFSIEDELSELLKDLK